MINQNKMITKIDWQEIQLKTFLNYFVKIRIKAAMHKYNVVKKKYYNMKIMNVTMLF